MSSRIHNRVSPEFLEQLREIRRGTPDNHQIFQFVRDFYPERTEEQIREIFEIQTETIFTGQIPNVGSEAMSNSNSSSVTFVTDPYQGKINPASSDGAKLFLKATQESAEKLEVKAEKSQLFIDQVTTDAQNFGWGGLVYGVPYQIDGTGQEVKENLLELYSQMDLKVILTQANKTWGNKNADLSTALPATHTVEVLDPNSADEDKTIFYRSVKARMIAKRVKGYLSLADWNTLKNQSAQFTWQSDEGNEWDGPTMLWILLNVINPEIKVSVNDLKEQIEGSRSSKFQHDVKKMTDFMSTKLREIKEKGGTHDAFLLHLYRALESVPNPDFNLEIKRSRREWEKGTTRWKTADPKDAKILALTTRVDNMAKIIEAAVAEGSTPRSNPSAYATRSQPEIEAWRMKTGQDSVTRGGKTWYWCPNHKFPGKFDGLYVTHHPSKHSEWLERKQADRVKRRGKKDKDAQPSGNSNNGGGKDLAKQRLTINGNLKAAMTTCTKLTDAQAREMLASYKAKYSSGDF